MSKRNPRRAKQTPAPRARRKTAVQAVASLLQDGWTATATAIVLLGAVLRWTSPDLVSITNDEGVHGILARNIAIFKDFPIVGLPSVGIRNSALFLYLLSIPYVLVRHPLAGVVFVAGLNVLALYWTIRITWERFGRASALVAGALYATSPWMVMYARNMWPPSCLAPACILFIAVCLRWLDEPTPGRLFAMIASGFLIPQIHFSGFCAMVWLAAVLAVGRRKISWPALAGGAVVGLATWAPWFYFQHVSTHWSDFGAVGDAARGKQGLGSLLESASLNYQRLLGADGFAYWFGVAPEELPRYFSAPLLSAANVVSWLLLAAFLSSVVWAVVQEGLVGRLLVLWVALPLILLAVLRPEAHPHYVLIAFPIPFILMGVLVGRRLGDGVAAAACSDEGVETSTEAAPPTSWRQRLLSRRTLSLAATSVVVGAVAAVHLAFLADWHRYLDADQATGDGHFELTYRQRQRAADAILNDCKGRLVTLVGPFNGYAPAYDLVYQQEQIDRGVDLDPYDPNTKYWVDQKTDAAPAPKPGWKTGAIFRIGPMRIYRLERIDGSKDDSTP